MPLIVISGNHDCNLSNQDKLDALSHIDIMSNIKNYHQFIHTFIIMLTIHLIVNR